jgi:hypothetical protein
MCTSRKERSSDDRRSGTFMSSLRVRFCHSCSNVRVMIQWCYNGVVKRFCRGCSNVVVTLQRFYRGVTEVLQWCHTGECKYQGLRAVCVRMSIKMCAYVHVCVCVCVRMCVFVIV